jgi:hypothetical protein
MPPVLSATKMEGFERFQGIYAMSPVVATRQLQPAGEGQAE